MEFLHRGIAQALEEFVPGDVYPDSALERLQRYASMLLEANKSVNLVSRRDTERHVLRFIRESLFSTGALAKAAGIRRASCGCGRRRRFR